MWFWFFDLVDLWVIEIKTSVILCALGTSRSSEQNRKHRSRSENMPKISLLYSQHNKIVWLSNIEDTICEKFTRCAKFCGLFFSDADWLGRQTLITWKQWTGKVEKNSIETAWRRELMTDGPKAASSSNTKVEVYSGIFTKPSNSVNTQRYSPPLRSTVVVLVVKPRLERWLLARASIVVWKPVDILSLSNQSERAKDTSLVCTKYSWNPRWWSLSEALGTLWRN